MTYYNGNLATDLESIKNEPLRDTLDAIGKTIGYGRAQQILQILWAQMLNEKDYPTRGALLPDQLTKGDKK